MNDEKKSGTLYVCATPIGNMEDITLRVLRILRTADFIAAEDTRHTQKILNHYQIETRATSYHEHNKKTKGTLILERLKSGESCAIVTDAGMPGISDPGEDLIALCYENQIEVTVCPGATAGVTALVLSGLPVRRYCFEAFLPADKKEKAAILKSLANETRTMAFYEAPHRLVATLKDLFAALGDRESAVIKELTKKHETVRKDLLSGQIAYFGQSPPKGEFVVVVKGMDEAVLTAQSQAQWNDISFEDHIARYQAQGMTEKDAMKKAAKDRGLSKRDIYNAIKK